MSDKTQAPTSTMRKPVTPAAIAAALTGVMADRNWSRPELARSMGVEVRTLSRFLDGKSGEPRAETLRGYVDYIDRMSDPATPGAVREESPPYGAVARQHRHFTALHEKASAEQKIWLAQLMLDTLEANMRDLREVLSLPQKEDSATSTPTVEQATPDEIRHALAEGVKKSLQSPPVDAQKGTRPKTRSSGKGGRR